MKRALLLAAALAFSAGAQAQLGGAQDNAAPVLDVQRLAPQLVAFAGGDVNFANLVNGLALGVPVTLTTTIAPGVTQVATFTPAGTMNATQIAQVLETARQTLISRGIVTPTAEQLRTALVGGNINTGAGTAVVTQSPAAAVQAGTSAAVGASAPRANTSDSRFPRGISDTPPLPNTTTTATPSTGTTPTAPGIATTPPAVATPAPAGTTPRLGATR